MSASKSPVESLLLHDGFVRALARSLLADPHAADDVAQQAWVVALEHGQRAESAPRWLTGVVRNLAGRLRRGEERRARREQERTRQGETPTAAEILEREAARTRVVQAVLALEDPYRECVLLRYFEGLPPRAIAQRLALPVETVRTRLKRALEVLRARLEREFGGGRACLGVALLPLARAPLAPPTGGLVPSVLASLAVMSTQAKLSGAIAGVALLALFLFVQRRGPALPGVLEPPPASAGLLVAPAEVPPALEPAAEPGQRAPVAAVASAAPAQAPTGAALRVRVSWSDGTPAEGIRVFVEPNWSDDGPSLHTREAPSDALGEARLSELPPGPALVSADRGEVAVGELVAGEEAEIALALPRGFDARGVVLDPSGAPVAGADVWVTRRTLEHGLVLARTDAAGRFHLRALVSGHIGARAPGFAPSLVQRLYAAEGREHALELVLGGPGGALAGTVLDSAGNPAAGAWVAAGLDHAPGVVRGPSLGGRQPASGVLSGPIETRTDADGRFRIEGLAPGLRQVAVRALGAGTWRGEADVVPHATRTLDVRLLPGVSLVGRVTRADGSPAQASVEVGDPFSMLYSSVSTAADGSFRLDDLEAGEFVVRAESARHGRARATLRGASGETLAWEARLDPGGAIRGRVLDATGAPLAGWQLQALDEPGQHEEPDFAGAESDAEGRFVLADLHARPHRVELRPPDLGLFAVLVRNGVWPEGEELVLRAELPSVWFAGSLADEAGAPVSDARLALFHPRLSRGRVFHPDARGNFEIGPCPPGRWTLSVSSPSLPECPALVLGPRALGPEEVFDCGTLVLARGERLIVEVPELAPGLEPEFCVPIEGGWPVRLEREGAGRVWRSGPLGPGSHRLQLRGRGVAAAQVAFEVRRGEQPRLTLALVPGSALALRVQAPESTPDLPPRLRIVDATGATVLTEELRLQPDSAGRVHAGDFGTEVALAPGLYRVEAWFEDGPRAAAELDLEPGAPAALRLELR